MTKRTHATDANTAAVVQELSDAGRGVDVSKNQLLGGTPAVAPGLVQFTRNHYFPMGVIKNPDVKFEDLPTEAEVIDPETGRPKKGIRYRVAKRSNPTAGNPEGVLHEIEKVDF